MNSPMVQCISECFVKPEYATEESKKPFYLGAWDLAMLSMHYMQSGLLFAKPLGDDCLEDLIKNLLERLKNALSVTLVHFYPLAGRLATRKEENLPSYHVFVDCCNSPGAKFIHAAVDVTMSDVVSPDYVPLVVRSFFDHNGAVNHDGHTRPLLSIQVTELADGVFIGCSMNHAIGDGTSFWHFFNTLSEIFLAQGRNIQIARPPVLKRWFPQGHGPLINLPFTHHDEFIRKLNAPQLLERFFHYSAESISKLKARANSEYNTNQISAFQSLTAFVWRSLTKARSFPPNQVVICNLVANNRSRLELPLSPDYFGNSVQFAVTTITAGELLEKSLGWAAWQLHQAVVNHTDKVVRGYVDKWLQSPSIYELSQCFDKHAMMMEWSPRFNMYGNEFGLGKALAVRSGLSHKFDGNVDVSPGREGGGSIDLAVCLQACSMSALESDEEFMAFVSSPI